MEGKDINIEKMEKDFVDSMKANMPSVANDETVTEWIVNIIYNTLGPQIITSSNIPECDKHAVVIGLCLAAKIITMKKINEGVPYGKLLDSVTSEFAKTL